MKSKKGIHSCGQALVFVFILICSPLILAAPPILNVAQLKELIPQLKEGGYVIYFRHAATDHSQEDKRPVKIEDCKTQRNLSSVGRSQARDIGNAFKQYRIPVGEVRSSPFCRCKDTADIAFGSSNTSENLYFAMGLSRQERELKGRLLEKMLSRPPPPGTNNIIVAHTANLQEAINLWPKPEGVAYIFKPETVPDPIAIVEPLTWKKLLR